MAGLRAAGGATLRWKPPSRVCPLYDDTDNRDKHNHYKYQHYADIKYNRNNHDRNNHNDINDDPNHHDHDHSNIQYDNQDNNCALDRAGPLRSLRLPTLLHSV
mmetsp:Transcript_84670/g.240161  ORF Transcript_84670/g.240161 Transcript_84670/m.240161 type:complete len:103 (-) Transcript_84670:321-629(-)